MDLGLLNTHQEGAASVNPMSGTKKRHNISLNAGANLLHRYQSNWSELHNQADENMKAADFVFSLILQINKDTSIIENTAARLAEQCSCLPAVISDIDKCLETINCLGDTFLKTERELDKLEILVANQHYYERKLQQKYQLAVYKDVKSADLDKIKSQLAKEHSRKVTKLELRQKEVLKKRHEEFRRAFDEEMGRYKSSGEIRGGIDVGRMTTSAIDISLEAISLDDDPEALNAFFEDGFDNGLKPVPNEELQDTDTSSEEEKLL